MAFTNLGEDSAQDHFAEGLADDLITDLSQVSGLFVIDRNATFAYRGKKATVKQIAEALGVRYVLQGSLRRAGDRLRINAQLVDATTGGTLWAERIDGDLEDVFAVQDRFTRAIVAALSLSLSVEEREAMARSQTDNIEARVAFQKGWGHYLRYTPADNAKALAQFKAAIEFDPGYGRAHAALALVYFRGCAWRWNSELDMDFIEANERALAHLEKAKARPSSLVNAAASQIYLYNKRYDRAFIEAARAIALDPNEPESYIAMAWAMITTGKSEASLDLVKRAMRLDPSAPNRYVLALGMAYFALGDLERAAGVYQKALERDPAAVELAAPLAAIYARLGRRQEARASLLLWKPTASQLDVELERLPLFYRLPYQWSTEARGVWEGLLDGLYVAALPLETTVQDLSHQLNEGGLIARQRAAESLGHFGPAAAEAVPALLLALVAENQFLRKVAAIALGKIGPGAKAAVPSLNAMQDEAFVGYFAKRALRDIAGG